jgi:uncharacterized protein YbjT (DUF2867 family)
MTRLVVAGATGYLGRFVVRTAADRDMHVTALVRDRRRVDGADEHVEVDYLRPETLEGVCDNADAVFSALGVTRQRDKVSIADVEHTGNANLLAEALRAGTPAFGVISVIHPERFAGAELLTHRERFIAELRDAPIASTVVRATGFFNDIDEVYAMARKGRVWLIGSGTTRINPIHGADLAEACLDALGTGTPQIQVGGPETFTMDEIADLAFRIADRPRRVTHLPDWLVGAALATSRVVSPRSANIIDFLRKGAAGDLVGTPTGTRTLEMHWSRKQETT